MAKNLTDAAVRKYAATSKRREIADARTAGLHLVIQPMGAKSWALRFRRPGGRSAKLTLGPVCFAGQELKGEPVIGMPLTLSAARLLAADIHRQRKMGRDVIAEYAADKHRRRVEQAEAGANTFAALARQFIAEHAQPKLRRWRETASVLGLHYPRDGREPIVIRDGLIERWRNKPVNEIDAHLVFSVVDESRRFAIPGRPAATKGLSDARGRLMARRLSKFFSWLVQHRKVATNPCLGGYVPPRGPARDRTLTPEELRWFWLACDQIGQPFSTLFKLLALTGCRREEVRGMKWAELSDDGSWLIPSERSKNARAHLMPLPPLARDLLAGVPHIENEAGLVFSNGSSGVGSFSRVKARLDAAMFAIARAERGKSFSIPPFTLHDLRRTLVTGLAELGVRPDVIEMAVNHVSGLRGGIAGVYNKSELLPERRAALERWSVHVQGLVSGKPTKIISLPRKGV